MFESPSCERRLLAELTERESRNTARMLRAFPPEQLDARCADCPHTARELAWAFVQRERLAHYLLLGRTAGADAPAPRTSSEILAAYEQARRETRHALARLSSRAWDEVLRGPIAPGRWQVDRRGELLWLTWKEQTRHVAHFAIHLREARERAAGRGEILPAPVPVPA
jgi:uncharacterized damage-inducible protein DinB